MDTRRDGLANAAARGDVNMLHILLESGADPNATNSWGRTPIQVMMMGNPQIARLLIRRGADPSVADPATGTCPAHDAAREGFLHTLLVLVEGGASIEGPLDNFGKSPLDLAPQWMKDKIQLMGIIDKS
ncbi:cyclin-dependent kinase 4 inhibitor B-like [Pelodytes ibericus]